ncbi:hypothetical protein B0T16DRAFT_450738 [Cercophora newfieldiana]|uniref:Uncharacterized protein n=1 Tax=Cercophora newfieldiana TaxID=92897 RepID=A0AA40CZP0_9PEZI|nr:hypothetical protein B0T16DRAFT_450738 [Cercophora newfieldiana]
MGNSQSSPSGTQFVNTEQPAIASYQQCHVFGDSNLYGVGIRTSYYLQYTAALLSLVFLRGAPDQGQKSWFLSFVPLVAANLVVLSLNAAGGGGGLVILDWAIVFGLVFWSIVFLVWPVFARRNGVGGALGLVGDPKPLQQALERELGRVVGDREAEWHARYVNVLREVGLEGEQGGEEKENRHRDLELALRDYVRAFTPARISLASTESTSYILDLYGDGLASHVATRMMIDNKQIESFRDSHTEALRLANVPFDQAQITTMALGRFALGELPLEESTPVRCSARQALTEVGYRVRTGGSVTSCGLGLLLYSGFLAFTVWALFRGVNFGARAGCNIRFVFLIAPASVYNRGAITTLRVFFCILFAMIGVPILLAGVALLALGGMDWWRGRPSNPHRKGTPDPSTFSTVPYDTEKGKETEIASPISPASPSRASRTTTELYEMDEFRTPTSPGTVRDTRGSSFFGGSILKDPEPAAGGAEMRGGRNRKPLDFRWKISSACMKGRWTYLLVLPVIHTITVVEVTVRINNLDMTARPMSTLGELLAFFLGVFVLIRILALCARESMRRIQRRRSAGWFQERRAMVTAPANMMGDPDFGRALRKEVSVGGESSFGDSKGKQRRIYMQPERKSGSSMGKFREMIDDGD